MPLQIVWIEVPVRDIERAAKFYASLFGLEYTIQDDGVRRTATLVYSNIGLSLNQTANFEPSDKGVYIYLGANADIDTLLPKVTAAGGKVITQKISMGQAGCYATVEDTEGNRFGLWSES